MAHAQIFSAESMKSIHDRLFLLSLTFKHKFIARKRFTLHTSEHGIVVLYAYSVFVLLKTLIFKYPNPHFISWKMSFILVSYGLSLLLCFSTNNSLKFHEGTFFLYLASIKSQTIAERTDSSPDQSKAKTDICNNFSAKPEGETNNLGKFQYVFYGMK